MSTKYAATLLRRNVQPVGHPTPAGLPGLIGYWDARDLPTGAVTTWAPRATSALGNFTGTGLKLGGGGGVLNPLMNTTALVNAASITTSTPVGQWCIFNVHNAGSPGTSPRMLAHIGQAGYDTLTRATGAFFFNYNSKSAYFATNTGTYVPAPGIGNPVLGARCLWITNQTSGTQSTLYTLTEDGTAATTNTPAWVPSAAYVYMGLAAKTPTYPMVGEILSYGICNQNIDADGRGLLRGWARSEFGVAA